jgi:pyruvate formate lyase activating enzyme
MCTECRQQAHVIKDGRHIFERSKCNLCGECINSCPCNALEFSNRVITQTELADEIGRQKSFYGSRGGVTFSGGEPLLQWEAISEFCDLNDVSVAIETCGFIDSEVFSEVLKKVDYIMYDLKLSNEEEHIKFTGSSNKIILENFELLKNSKTDFCVRTPLIPGITDTEENLAALKVIIGDKKWEKLEYNTMAPQKYEWLGMKYDL